MKTKPKEYRPGIQGQRLVEVRLTDDGRISDMASACGLEDDSPEVRELVREVESILGEYPPLVAQLDDEERPGDIRAELDEAKQYTEQLWAHLGSLRRGARYHLTHSRLLQQRSRYGSSGEEAASSDPGLIPNLRKQLRHFEGRIRTALQYLEGKESRRPPRRDALRSTISSLCRIHERRFQLSEAATPGRDGKPLSEEQLRGHFVYYCLLAAEDQVPNLRIPKRRRIVQYVADAVGRIRK